MRRKGGLVWYQSIDTGKAYIIAIFLVSFKGASRFKGTVY